MRHKKVITTILSILVIVLVAYLGAGLYFYHMAVVPSHKGFLHNQTQIERTGKAWYAANHAQKWHETSATKHLKLDADYVPAAKRTKRTVLIAHGFMGDKNTMYSYAKMFHKMGDNVLVPDDRGQGQSQGNYIGYGWPDRLDYRKWMHKIIMHNGQNSQIMMFGVSMGGATTMMTSGTRGIPRQVKGYIEDCGYTGVYQEINHEARKLYHMPWILRVSLIPLLSKITQIKDGYNFSQASAINQVKKNRKPMLFIHGSKDHFVPTYMGKQNYKADHSPKRLLIVKGASHAASKQHSPKLYRKVIRQFMSKYF